MEYKNPSILKEHPSCMLVPPMRKEEYSDLMEDIKTRGIKVPIEILPNETIIDGRHRWLIARELGLKKVPTKPAPIGDESDMEYMLKAAIKRRHLTDDQRAAMAALWKDEHKEQGKGRDLTSPQRCGKVNTVQKSVSLFNIPRRKIDEATKLLHKNLKALTEVHQGKLKLKKALREIELEEKREAIKHLKTPKGKYDVIVVDPPWPYRTEYDPDTRRAASPYPEMSIEEIKKMKTPASDNCILWLWTTNQFMHEAYHILEVWGFTPKTILTWVKPKIGLGVWLRGQTEHCILAVKGKPIITLTNQSTVLDGRLEGHSNKPDEFYKLAEDLCSGKKLDIYFGEGRKGWKLYGTGR